MRNRPQRDETEAATRQQSRQTRTVERCHIPQLNKAFVWLYFFFVYLSKCVFILEGHFLLLEH